MDRLKQLREVINSALSEYESPWGYVHSYGVSAACVLLAKKRGLDPEMAAVCGMLHDIATYQTGEHTDHAPRSAVQAERILTEIGCFTPAEIELVRDAIAMHAAKDAVDGDMAECLKDADVLQHHLCNPGLKSNFPERLKSVLAELDLP